uniref:Uncharacterized protein n=1 Tax=Salix viminalis TaxID=40686 RepID=A0A6N2KLU6_SALVM
MRLRVTKTFKHKKNPKIWSIIGRRKWRKRSVWVAAVGRERGEEDIVISQAIRILNPSWAGSAEQQVCHIRDAFREFWGQNWSSITPVIVKTLGRGRNPTFAESFEKKGEKRGRSRNDEVRCIKEKKQVMFENEEGTKVWCNSSNKGPRAEHPQQREMTKFSLEDGEGPSFPRPKRQRPSSPSPPPPPPPDFTMEEIVREDEESDEDEEEDDVDTSDGSEEEDEEEEEEDEEEEDG